MAEPTLADVLASLKTLSTEMSTMKADLAAMKEKSASSSDSAGGRKPEEPRDNDFPPKPKKWDFPRYDGTTDPLLFLNKCESYFRHHRTMAEERVWMASYHLDEVAQLWYTQLLEDEGAPPWGRFKELLHLRFGPPLRSAPLFELAECRRTGTVEDYANRFQGLLPRAGRLEEAQLHGWSPSTPQPRRPHPQPGDPSRCDEFGSPSRTHGGRTPRAAAATGTAPRSPPSASTVAGAACTPRSRPAGPRRGKSTSSDSGRDG